jgi:phage repressor protein C with HTH and peptisase S24 domain
LRPQPSRTCAPQQAQLRAQFDSPCSGGFPVGQGWDQIRFPRVDDDNAYALEVTGNSMQPLYRDGDMIVSPNSAARKGDRVVVRTTDGEVMAKILVRRTAKAVELASFNPAHRNLVFPSSASTGWRASSGRRSDQASSPASALAISARVSDTP